MKVGDEFTIAGVPGRWRIIQTANGQTLKVKAAPLFKRIVATAALWPVVKFDHWLRRNGWRADQLHWADYYLMSLKGY